MAMVEDFLDFKIDGMHQKKYEGYIVVVSDVNSF